MSGSGGYVNGAKKMGEMFGNIQLPEINDPDDFWVPWVLASELDLEVLWEHYQRLDDVGGIIELMPLSFDDGL